MSSFGPASGPVPDPEPPAPSPLDYSGAASRQPIVPWVTSAIVRHRRLILICSLIPLFISFNGRWRMGLDSSLYRGMARSLAQGNGYHFGDFEAHQIYPGLPILLAGMDKVFGENIYRPIAPLIFMLLMSLVILLLVYRLIAQNYPQWMAICVTAGVAMNSWFIRQSHELMTDIPFLLGVMMGLLGWDLLRNPVGQKPRWRAALLMTAGLALAAVMRPTFWILCLALLCAWGVGLLRAMVVGRGWKLYLSCLGILVALTVSFLIVDPRTGMHPLSGGYEAEMLDSTMESKAPPPEGDPRAESLLTRSSREMKLLLTQHLPAAFLGQELPETPDLILSILLVISALVMLRRQPIWGMFIIYTLLVTSMLSSSPRYYVMILPFLFLGSLLLLRMVGEWLGGGWCDLLLAIGLAGMFGMNIGKIVPFVIEQQRVSPTASDMQFFDTYRRGKFRPVIHLAELIRDKLPPTAPVITPSAQIVRYLSDRDVITERDLFPNRHGMAQFPQRLADRGIKYAAFPPKIYQDKEPLLCLLMKHGVMIAGKRVAEVDGIRLSQAIVLVRSGDWQRASPPAPATRPTTRPTTHRATSRPTSRPTTRAVIAKHRAATQRAAATRAARLRRQKRESSTTAPSTTQPTVKKKKKAATGE